MKGDVGVPSKILFTTMQMRDEGNVHVAKRLKTGYLKDPSLLIVEILGAHVPPYSLASGEKRTTETSTKNALCLTCKLLGEFLLNNLRYL